MATATDKPKTAPQQTTDVARGGTTTPPANRRESPLEFMRRLSEEMNRSFDRFFEDFGLRMPGALSRGRELIRRETGLIPAEWSPRLDVLEREGQFLVRADLPGLSREDVKVELTDDTLTIQGERKQEKKEEREGCYYSECSYGSFYRAIPLPEGVDTSQATAAFRNGVLEIAMPAPKRPEPQARRLEIQEQP